MPPAIAVVRGCYQTSVAQTGTRFRLQHWRQLRPASFYEHRYPLGRKSLRLCLAELRIRRFDTIAEASELPDHFRSALLLRLFGNRGAPFFVTNSLVQD